MATIIIPFPFRKYTDNRREVTVAGVNLAEIVEGLLKQHPGLQVINDQPGLLSIFINDKSVKGGVEEWQAIRVGDSDEISLIIPIAGG
jgi:hypothetical protein